MLRTSGTVERSGIYQSICADRTQMRFDEGQEFPECPFHGPVDWKLIRERELAPFEYLG